MRPLVALLVVCTAGACFRVIPVDGAPCPCEAGYVCCPRTQTCQFSCQSDASGGPGAGSGGGQGGSAMAGGSGGGSFVVADAGQVDGGAVADAGHADGGWFCAPDGGLFEVVPPPPGEVQPAALATRGQFVFVGTDQGLFEYSGGQWVAVPAGLRPNSQVFGLSWAWGSLVVFGIVNFPDGGSLGVEVKLFDPVTRAVTMLPSSVPGNVVLVRANDVIVTSDSQYRIYRTVAPAGLQLLHSPATDFRLGGERSEWIVSDAGLVRTLEGPPRSLPSLPPDCLPVGRFAASETDAGSLFVTVGGTLNNGGASFSDGSLCTSVNGGPWTPRSLPAAVAAGDVAITPRGAFAVGGGVYTLDRDGTNFTRHCMPVDASLISATSEGWVLGFNNAVLRLR